MIDTPTSLERLKQLKTFWLENLEHWNQSTYHNTAKGRCKHCILGMANLLEHTLPVVSEFTIVGYFPLTLTADGCETTSPLIRPYSDAREWLGLTNQEAAILTNPENDIEAIVRLLNEAIDIRQEKINYARCL